MAPVQGSKCIKWTVDEHAFVLNFTDYCLYHEQDYQKEIILELPKLTNGGRTATLGTVLKRVMLILKNDCKIKRPKINDFIKQGTSYLPLDKLPKAWVARMEEQRREWKIPQFKEPLSKDKHNHTKHPNARGRRCKSPNLQGGAKDPIQVCQAASIVPEGQHENHTLDEHLPANLALIQAHEAYGRIANSARTTTVSGIQQLPYESGPAASYQSASHASNNLRRIQEAQTAVPICDGGSVIHGTNTSESESQTIGLLSELSSALLRRLQSGRKVSGEEIRCFISIDQTVQREKGEAFSRMVEEMIAIDRENARKSELIEKLIGNQSLLETISVPEIPSARLLEAEWKSIRNDIKIAVMYGLPGQIAPPRNLDYFARQVDLFVEGQCSEEELTRWVNTTAPLHWESQYTIQTLLSALIVRWMFGGSALELTSQHSLKFDEMYEKIRTCNGIAAVKHLDSIVTKLLVDNKDFQRAMVPNIVRSLYQRIADANLPRSVSESFKTLPTCFEQVTRLKHKLIASPMDYRIYFCRPGTEFNREWMEAEDEEGHHLPVAQSRFRKVRLCLFPAIAEQQMMSLSADADLAEALSHNKRFLPGDVGRNNFPDNSNGIISKAVVMVESSCVGSFIHNVEGREQCIGLRR